MPKIRVGWDERYPDFYISTDPHDREIEVTEEELAEIASADEAYRKAQAILARARKR
jgi:hypothetical protein